MSPLGGAKLVLAVLLVGVWLALLAGTPALPAGAGTVALFLGLGLWRPRLALGALVAFAAVTPLAEGLVHLYWFSAAEGGLLALWLALAWRERSAARRPLDLAGTMVLLFGLYVVLATLALVVRYRYPSWALGFSLLRHPLGELLQLQQAHPFYGFRAGTLLLEGMLAFLLARRVDGQPGEGRATLWGLLAGGCIAVASYFVFYLPRLLEPSKNWLIFRPALTLHDPNSAASFGLLVLGAGLAMALRRPKAWPLYLVPGLLVFFFGGSRAAYIIALPGCLGIVAALLWARKRRGGRPAGEGDLADTPALAPVLLVLVVLASIAGLLAVRSQHFHRLVTGQVFATDYYAGRLGFWQSGLQMVARYPLSGIGAGEFPLALPLFTTAETAPTQTTYENAHCYPLQLAAEYGLPGLLLWVGLLYVVLAPRLRHWRVLSPEAAGLLVGTLFYLLHCLQSHPLLLPEQQILFWAALGGLAGGFSKLQEPAGPSGLRWAAALCLLAPLWSLTQPLPAAAEARGYLRYPSEGAQSPWAWTSPRLWFLAEGPRAQFDLYLARPDLDRSPAGVTLRLSSGGVPLWSQTFRSPERLRATVTAPAGAPGALLLLEVSPSFVPRDFNRQSWDTRALGVLISGPRPSAPDGPSPPGPTSGVALTVGPLPSEPLETAARVCSCAQIEAPAEVEAGATFPVGATFRNGSPLVWPGGALLGSPLQLSAAYHWRREDGSAAVWDGARTPLASDIPAGGTWRASLAVSAPAAPGRYRLEVDLVQEQVGWFSCSDNAVAVTVRPAP